MAPLLQRRAAESAGDVQPAHAAVRVPGEGPARFVDLRHGRHSLTDRAMPFARGSGVVAVENVRPVLS